MSESRLPLFRSDVNPRPKGEARVWVCRVGAEGCTRDRPCPSCRGRRNRNQGLAKQRVARKQLGVPPTRFKDSNEESWRWQFRCEVKSGQIVKALTSRFLAAEKQAETSRAVGDPRPFMFCAMPVGMSDGLVCVRLSVWRSAVAPYLEGNE